jgi:aryl-alcohol dehydrogenase-like predicted oxidoreductase
MAKKKISRKKFILSSLAGFTGISLISRPSRGYNIASPVYRELGNTGISVTPVCFGAPRTNEESLIRFALDNGINFIDTGRAYGNGNNELLVGRAVAGRRNNVVIQSKIRLEMDELPSRGTGKKGTDEIRLVLTSKLEASLKALNTDYIDILLYHDALDEKLLFHDATIKFFTDMKIAGKIRANGFSTHNEYMNLPERNIREKVYDINMVPFNHKGSFVHSVSGRYSEWDQTKLTGILENCAENGIGIIAMKTCSGGKYSPSNDTGPDYKEAVRWVLRNKFISSAAIALANYEQVTEHLILVSGVYADSGE